jgi:hypothetical protein
VGKTVANAKPTKVRSVKAKPATAKADAMKPAASVKPAKK